MSQDIRSYFVKTGMGNKKGDLNKTISPNQRPKSSKKKTCTIE